MSEGLPEQQGDLEEYIEVLTEHQHLCEQNGKYVEADMAKERVAQLKVQLQYQRKNDLKNRHNQERMGVEKAHLDEFNQFNEFWDRKMQEFDSEAIRIENELIQRQDEEFQRVNQELEKSLPFRQKDSSEVLNLKKIEENLAKQKNYQEAHKVQAKRQVMEKEENNQWQITRANKIKNQLNQLKQRQQNELNALRKRIQSGQDEQRKNRSIELERLLQKYQNVKKELGDQHEKEVLHFDKQFKNKAVTSLQMGGSQKLSSSQKFQ